MKSRVLALIFAIVVPATAYGDPIRPPSVPAEIALAAGFKPFLAGHAVGTQNYVCTMTPQGIIKWQFIGPQATVFDAAGQQILTHFQSENPLEPGVFDATWRHSRDTSAVWARRLNFSTDPDYVAADAIEWLLLGTTAKSEGPNGGDKMTATVFIHRVNTIGGKEPATGCSASTLTTRKMVPYEADYILYK